MLQYISSKKVILRNRYYLLAMIFFVTVGMSIVIPETIPQSWHLLSFPASFIVANYLAVAKSTRWATATLSLLFVGAFIVQAIVLFSAR